MYEKVESALSLSNNPFILEAIGRIFRTIATEPSFSAITNLGSSSSLDAESSYAGQMHLRELEKIGMQGMLHNHHIVPSETSIQMVTWIPEVVSSILTSY